MSRYHISYLARLDLDEIHDRIANDKPQAARRWLEKTINQFAWLANNPVSGQTRDDILPGLRSFSHGNYVSYFRTRTTYLEFVRVLHGARDIERLF